MVACQRCGAQVNGRFCANCGAALSLGDGPVGAGPPPAPASPGQAPGPRPPTATLSRPTFHDQLYARQHAARRSVRRRWLVLAGFLIALTLLAGAGVAGF